MDSLSKKRFYLIRSLLIFFCYAAVPFIFQDFLAYSYSRCIYVLLTLIIAYSLYGRLAFPLGNKVLFCVSTFLIEVCFFSFSILKFVHLYGVGCGVFFLFFMYIWSFLFLLTALRVLDFFVNKKKEGIRKKEKIRVDYLCFGIVLFCGLIKSLVYYPGVISEDTAYLYYVSHSLDIVSNRSDLHSFFYALLCALIFKINSSYYFLTFLTTLSLSLVWKRCIKILYSVGVEWKVLVGITVLLLTFPNTLWLLAASWKDVPFTICMILFFAESVKCIFSEETGNGLDWFFVVLSLFGIANFRSNGLFVVTGTVIAFLLLYCRKKNIPKKFMMSILLSFLLVLCFKTLIFTVGKVGRDGGGFAALPFLDGVWECAKNGRQLTKETKETIREIMPYKKFLKIYRLDCVNIYEMPNGYWDLNTRRIIKAFFSCIKKYPMDILVGRMKRTFLFWSVFPDPDYPVYYSYQPVIKDYPLYLFTGYHYISRFEPLRQIFGKLLTDSDSFLNLYFSLNRCGINIVTWIILGNYLSFRKRKKLFILGLPIFLNTFILLLCSCFQTSSYTYPMLMITPLFMVVVVSLSKETLPKEG